MSLDPVTLQVLVGALRSACDEMGAVLVRAAHSANVKERRDCSTALFDPRGELVMQAEHIPVHLGSMPDAVAAVIGDEQRRGDLWVLNDPYRGGTHLPDITLIAPVFDAEGLRAFAASRAHHADVGGPTPAGMPARSTRLEEEGIVIPPTRVDAGSLAALADRMRRPDERRADLLAQRSALAVGERRLGELAERYGPPTLRTGMAEILDYAERRSRARLDELPDGSWTADDVLEGGPHGAEDVGLRVSASIRGSELELDFTGSAAQVAGNLNCPLPVTKSAALGAHRPVRIHAPEGSVLNARPPAAVAAGNVETSSRVADLVISALGGALEVPAHGQGTMNNLTLAGEGFAYYETIGGGQGACPGANGPSAIHVAMSNTLNTPIEALETELPLRVRALGLRRGSGGAGRRRGGDGIVRELEALAPMRFTLIAERRRHPPRGRTGGADGAPGRDTRNGKPLPSKAEGRLAPGDRLRIETPGGGGWGEPR